MPLSAQPTLAIASLLLITSCSNEAVYEMIQADQIQKCQRQSIHDAYVECKEEFEKDYDAYKQEREAILQD